MRKTFANYDHCLTNFTNTILNYFGFETYHEILENLNRKLKQKQYENVVVINIRGMSSNSIKNNLEDSSFLRCNKIDELSSTFPASKLSSNTSLKTGLNPIEHGIINEKIKLKKAKKLEDKNIVNIINSDKDKRIKAFEFGKEEGRKYKDLPDLLERIQKTLEKKGKKYIYADYNELDDLVKVKGYDDKDVKKEIKRINKEIEKFTKKLNDTVVFVISDHGYLNATPVPLNRYKIVYNLLKEEPLIEPRSCHFFIKEGKKLDFEQIFIKFFVNDFILISKNEAKSKDIFGTGTDHSLLEEPIGDYVAVAINDKYFTYNQDDKEKPMPAGITEEEMFVPLIMIDKK